MIAVVIALVIIWALFVPLADWLAHHDVGSVKGSVYETAVDNARGRLLTLGAGLFAAGALWFTARSFTLAREGQVTDRYTAAITQLGSKKLDVRIGGIYALERVARDSARDHRTVMEVLTAFIREHSLEPSPKPGPTVAEHKWPDVRAAITVVGRRDARRDARPIDLHRANLASAYLVGANLMYVTLINSDLTEAVLQNANLADVVATHADLTGADIENADLTRAYLTDANLTGAYLAGANLTDAILADANLTDAELTNEISGDANLTGTNLTGATWPGSAPVPEGWKLDTDSGRLTRAAVDSGPGEVS